MNRDVSKSYTFKHENQVKANICWKIEINSETISSVDSLFMNITLMNCDTKVTREMTSYGLQVQVPPKERDI